MNHTSGIPANIKTGISIAISILIWLLLAPPELGGSTRYAMVIGKSMLPTLRAGDLVLLRTMQDYRAGEIIGFYDPNLNAVIVHRIITIVNGQYKTQGDNNQDADLYSPQKGDVLGRVILRAPLLGNIVAVMKQPLVFTGVVGLMIVFLWATFRQPASPHDRQQREVRLDIPTPASPASSSGTSGTSGFPQQASPKSIEAVNILLVILVILSLGFVIWTFSLDRYQTVDPVPYSQTGRFSYTASAIPGIYDSDSARTGDPVFTQITCILNVTYDYTIAGSGLEFISGTYQTYARVQDKKSGWTKTIPLTNLVSFSGPNLTTTSSIDLCQIRSMIEATEEMTGIKLGSYSMDVIAAVELNGQIQGVPLQEHLVSTLSFIFERLNLYVNQNNNLTDPFTTQEQKSIDSQKVDYAVIDILGREVRVISLRILSIALLVLFGTFLGVFLYQTITVMNTDINRKIELQYGALVIDSSDFILKFAPVIEFGTIDELARLAIYNHTVILRTRKDPNTFYTVRIGEISYRYIANTPTSFNS